ncbi:unnamed protein product, partial [Discosporangium mesarthrocarpum]
RRPPPEAVRQARQLHAAGRVWEAAQVAMEALDGTPGPGGLGTGGANAATGPPRVEDPGGAGGGGGGGGGTTTRMMREDLANSLLGWLVSL